MGKEKKKTKTPNIAIKKMEGWQIKLEFFYSKDFTETQSWPPRHRKMYVKPSLNPPEKPPVPDSIECENGSIKATTEVESMPQDVSLPTTTNVSSVA